MVSFQFKLHPRICRYDKDASQLFKAEEQPDGTYIVSFHDGKKEIAIAYTYKEVFESVAEKEWIIQE